MQALEWCLLPEEVSAEEAPRVRAAVTVGCPARLSPWQVALSETQRQAIYTDPRWRDGDVDPT